MSRSRTSSPPGVGRHAALLFAILSAAPARAADEGSEPARDDIKRACVAQHEAAQFLKRAGKLTEARETMLACAQVACPTIIRADCEDWSKAVAAAIPSVLVSAKAGDRPEEDVTVAVDGKVVASRLDGRPIDMDPGAHVLRFETAAHAVAEQTVTLSEGEKERPVSVRFEPVEQATPIHPAPPALAETPLEPRRPVPTGAYVLGAVAVAGAAAFAGFGVWGLAERASLQSSCSPSCSGSQVSAVRTKLLVADAGLGVGVLSLAGATYLYLTRPAVRQAGRLFPYVPPVATTWVVAPTRSGAMVSVEGGF